MTPDDRQKITLFLADRHMSSVVYQVLLKAFLKKRDHKDVHMLASSRMAIDQLEEAWTELDRLKNETEKQKSELKQVGM